MKRLLFVGALILAVLFASAQTQQGYVRTLGRPEKAGEPLSEVTVKVKGQHNTVKSNSNGNFEMVLEGLRNGDAYALQQVRKNGYELNESDIIGRPLAFSDKVPLTIVMVSSAQLQADKQRIENNAYMTAEKNYKAKYNLLERQLNDNEISIERYREEIQDLLDKFEKYQSLIDGLAEHYAHTDYDLLDEKDREINLCIENGELERADSLIRLLFDPIGVLERNIEALERLEQQISKAGEELSRANEDMAAVLKQQEKDAEYLYQLFTIALAKFDNEKALFYIETRAALDSTNVEWQLDAGDFLENYMGYHDKARIYFQTGLRQSLLLYGEYNIWTVLFLNNLGSNYSYFGNYIKAQEYLEQALNNQKALDSSNMHIASSAIHTNLGFLYESQGNHLLAIQHYNIALSILYNHFGGINPKVVIIQNDLGSVYERLIEHDKALEHYSHALDAQEELFGVYHPVTAAIYNNIAFVYANKNLYEIAIESHKKALAIRQKIYGENHYLVGASYFNIGKLYEMLHEYEKAIEYHEKALQNLLFGLNRKDNSDIAFSYNRIGTLYLRLHNYKKALENYEESLNIFQKIDDQKNVATLYGSIGTIYDDLGQYDKAIDYYEKGLKINKGFWGEESPIILNFKKAILVAKYRQSLAENLISVFCEDHCFTATIVDGDNPASLQGMSGEYILLEFADWRPNSPNSLFDKNTELRGKPKDILVMKDGQITQHHFENAIGAQLSLKFIDKEENQRINKAYEDWKKQHRQ